MTEMDIAEVKKWTPTQGKNIILVYGLPGSGKTTLAVHLQRHLADSVHINADCVRAAASDWDFSDEGRLRQAERMHFLAEASPHQTVILDFVCPRAAYRTRIRPSISLFMDTIKEGRFADTNSLFERPDTDGQFVRFTDGEIHFRLLETAPEHGPFRLCVNKHMPC